ncbi:MAG: hypothetical protein MJE77_08325 [Proteobacteria bacterium]|nr:hypothetical protein [Pseudomonadota bacterium]
MNTRQQLAMWNWRPAFLRLLSSRLSAQLADSAAALGLREGDLPLLIEPSRSAPFESAARVSRRWARSAVRPQFSRWASSCSAAIRWAVPRRPALWPMWPATLRALLTVLADPDRANHLRVALAS